MEGFKNKAKRAIRYTLERLKEPSTWTAISVIGTLAHVQPEFLNNLSQAAPVVAGVLLGVFLPEKAPQE